MKLTTRKLVVSAVMAALIFVLTFFFQIKLTPQGGYFNLGDTLIYFTAYVLGGLPAMLAAGIGSMLSDLLSGAAIYAPATLVIKAAMGIVAAIITFKPSFGRYLIACILGGAIMVVGYGLYDFFVFGLGAMIPDLLGNLFQWGFGAGIAILLFKPAFKLRKTFRFREEPASK